LQHFVQQHSITPRVALLQQLQPLARLRLLLLLLLLLSLRLLYSWVVLGCQLLLLLVVVVLAVSSLNAAAPTVAC
jgi:hypothetical protein